MTDPKPTAPFWLVWRPSGFPPEYKHATAAAAVIEAERIARLSGDPVYVLEAICVSRKVDVDTVAIGERSVPRDDEIPF